MDDNIARAGAYLGDVISIPVQHEATVDLCEDGSILLTIDGRPTFELNGAKQLVAKINGNTEAWAGRKANGKGVARWQTSIFGPVT